MTWLVVCEYSGRVRDALILNGVDAVSCDILPTEKPGPHIQGDVIPLLERRWSGIVAHPPLHILDLLGGMGLQRTRL